MSDLTNILQPIELGAMRVANRLTMPTHGTRLSQRRYLRYLEERARDGVGLIGVPAGFGIDVPLGPGQAIAGYAGDFDAVLFDPATIEGVAYYDERVIPMLRSQAEVVHRHGAVCVGQVHHAGASRNQDNLQPAIGPSSSDTATAPTPPSAGPSGW